jgi:hypothetical protein
VSTDADALVEKVKDKKAYIDITHLAGNHGERLQAIMDNRRRRRNRRNFLKNTKLQEAIAAVVEQKRLMEDIMNSVDDSSGELV